MQRSVDFIQEEQSDNRVKAHHWPEYASRRRGELTDVMDSNGKPDMEGSLAAAVRGRDTAFLAHCFRQGLVKKPEGVGPIKPHVDTVSAVAKRLQMTRGVVPVNMAVKT